MSSELHKAPLGLLDLFRLRVLGEQPNKFGREVQPSVEVGQFYGLDRTTDTNDSLTAVAITQTIIHTIGNLSPGGPALIETLGGLVIVGAAAGTQIRMLLGVRTRPTSGLVYIGENVITAPVAGGFYAVVGMVSRPMLLPPSGQVVLEVQGNAAGVDHTIALRSIQTLLGRE
jgi:hypothetical protein